MQQFSTATRRNEVRDCGGLIGALFALLIRSIATLLLTILLLLEPLIQPVLCAIALLALGTALFFRFLIGDAEFPFSGMLGLSLVCILLLALYYRVVRLLCFGN